MCSTAWSSLDFLGVVLDQGQVTSSLSDIESLFVFVDEKRFFSILL